MPAFHTEHLVVCRPAHHTPVQPTPHTICISCSPNPEFAANPTNFGHWSLALLFPLLAGLRNATAGDDGLNLQSGLQRSTMYLLHGANRLGTRWTEQYEQIFGASCVAAVLPHVPHKASAQEIVYNHSRGQVRNCSTVLRAQTPKYAFCHRSHWTQRGSLTLFATDLRRLLLRPARPALRAVTEKATSTVVVLQRSSSHDKRLTVTGLARACESAYALHAQHQITRGVAVICLSPGKATPLRSIALKLGNAVGLVGVHGAGLSNALFLRPGAALIEVRAATIRFLPSKRVARVCPRAVCLAVARPCLLRSTPCATLGGSETSMSMSRTRLASMQLDSGSTYEVGGRAHWQSYDAILEGSATTPNP